MHKPKRERLKNQQLVFESRMSESKPLAGRVALVTGSSSGIGKAVATKLAKRGASLLIHGSRPSGHLNEALKSLHATGSDAKLLTADFRELDSLERFFQNAWNVFGGIDILVNNAGADVLTGDAANEPFTAKLERVWQVDVRATLMASRIIGNMMLERFNRDQSKRGSIINIGWDQAWQGMAGESGEMFATTKGAIMSMTMSLAQSLAPGARVNCVAPGWIKTKWGEGTSEKWSARAVSESLMNRWGTPEDVANAVNFLSGDDSSFISGQVIPVNGGFRFSS